MFSLDAISHSPLSVRGAPIVNSLAFVAPPLRSLASPLSLTLTHVKYAELFRLSPDRFAQMRSPTRMISNPSRLQNLDDDQFTTFFSNRNYQEFEPEKESSGLFTELFGNQPNLGPSQEVVDRAKEKWLGELEQIDEQAGESLYAVKEVMNRREIITKSEFETLFSKIEPSDSAKYLLLDLAILFDSNKLVNWMLERNVSNSTTLNLMIRCQNSECVEKYIAQFGQQVNLNELSGDSNALLQMAPIHYAVKSGSLEVVEQLLKSGVVMVDQVDEGGGTPLLIAVLGSDLETSKLLLDYGACPLLKNIRGESPLILAIEAIAAKPLYDLDNQSYKMGIDMVEPKCHEIVVALIDAAAEDLQKLSIRSSIPELDQLILRLISSDKDQTGNIVKLFRARQALAAVHGLDPAICCETQVLAEPIFAIGNRNNIELAINDLGITFTGDAQAKRWLTVYPRNDLQVELD